MSIDWAKLSAPFAPSDVDWRLQRCGEKNGRIWAVAVPYIDARNVMDRLDEVVGRPDWEDDYQAGPIGGVMCTLRIKVDGEWVSKRDVAGPSAIEPIKGANSDAFKRAAVKWGIGRFLYEIKDTSAIISENGRYSGSFKDKSGQQKQFRWDPPRQTTAAKPASAQKKSAPPAEPPKQAAPQEPPPKAAPPADSGASLVYETAAAMLGSEATKAMTALMGAKTPAELNKYHKVIGERLEAMQYTSEEGGALQAVFTQRSKELVGGTGKRGQGKLMDTHVETGA